MPIYEYECQHCQHRFEVRRHFGDDGATPCPQCHGPTRRLFTPVPIIFKGSGFYVTDYRKDRGTGEEKSESKSEKKSED
ncbi:MAG: hypothetical protein N2506_06855 [Dehalococcoidales bacterium]|nr:hypothetical protein [Dehalococcoidales bacterium]